MEQAAFRRHNYKQLIAVSFPGSLHQESPPNQDLIVKPVLAYLIKLKTN